MSLRYPHLYLIGLTGNIGCGKSTIAAMLRERGAAVCDADQVTRQVMRPSEPAYDAIVAAFGPGILHEPGGSIDRPALGRIVFSDPTALRTLETIVHPATRHAIEAWLGDQELMATEAGIPSVAVVDAIKLIENGYPAICDAVWVVVCDEREQLRRLVEHRGMSAVDAQQRIVAQPPQANKVAVADVVIDNSSTISDTEAQVERAWRAAREAMLASTQDS